MSAPRNRFRPAVVTALCGVLALFTGCENKNDPLLPLIRGASAKISLMKFTPPAGALQQAAGSSALQAAAAAPDAGKRVAIKAIKDVDASFKTFRNPSYGKFTAQVTVALNSLVGMTDGKSLGFLEFRQPFLQPDARRLHIGAVYDAAGAGLRAAVFDAEGNPLGSPIDFPGAHEVDLRIEQTETEFILSARQTPAAPSAAGWMPVHTVNEAPDPAPFHLYIGIRNVKKSGVFFFSNFALDGEAIGGHFEYPIIVHLRTAVEAIRSAQAKITAAAPDVAGALTDLDAAVAAHDLAAGKLQTDFSKLQNRIFALQARKTLNGVTDDLAAVRAVAATLDAKKAQAQVKKLDTIAGAEIATMANLLSASVPNLKAAPPIFSLRIP